MSILEVRALTKLYPNKRGGTPVRALSDVSFSIAEGEIHAILGLNGAGKTTLIKILSGLLLPDSGELSINGRSASHSKKNDVRIGALFEGSRNLYWRLSSMENLEYFGMLRGLGARQARDRANALLDEFGLSDKKRVLVKDLSRGMQQRLSLAVALVHNPMVLLLDEPTVGVDIENLQKMLASINALRDSKVAILLTSHQMEVVETLSDRISILKGGRIVVTKPTANLVSDLQIDHFFLELAADLGPSRLQKLHELGCRVDGRRITCQARNELIYELLEITRPIEILALRRGDLNFAEAFLETVRRN